MIVAVVAELTAGAVRRRLDALARDPGRRHVMAEVRLDTLERPDVACLKRAPVDVIATCRRLRDGGSWAGVEDERRDLLAAALEAGARFVDVEVDVLEAATWARGERVLASYHDFNGTPSDLEAMVARALSQGAAKVKLAVRATDLSDLLRVARVAARSPTGRVVAFGLGPVGVLSRLLYRRMGSPWVYARVTDEGPEIAPGLPSLQHLGGLFHPDPSLPEPVAAFGILGDRAEDSAGPLVFNRVFRKCGVPAIYVPVSAPRLTGVREAMHLFGLRGLSVTTPHKEAALALADEVHPLARAVGAANTLILEDGRLAAYDFDYHGVREPLLEALGGEVPAGARALVAGAGGAGRAAALALRHLGLDVALWSRRPERAAAAARDLGVQAAEAMPSRPPDVLVNATPAGGARDPDGLPVPASLVAGGDQVVFEMNYGRTTPLLRLARERGSKTVAGDAMYVAQAVHQLHAFWGGLSDARRDVEEALSWALASRASC